MPVSPTYPGVYVQEVPSGVRTIVGVGTSTGMFIGTSKYGPINKPIRCANYSAFKQKFGDDINAGQLGPYVRLFFLNGGTDCYAMRIANGAAPAAVTLENEAGNPTLTLTAVDEGSMGNNIRAIVTYSGPQPEVTFNLQIFLWDTDSAGRRVKTKSEVWHNLSMDPSSPAYAIPFLNQNSDLVNALDLNPPAPANPGFSLSGRSMTNAALVALLASKNKFEISVDGSAYVRVDLTGISGTTGSITTAINNAFAAAGMVTTSFVAGVPSGNRIQIASAGSGDVFVRPSPTADDLAVPLMLGTAQGGIEVSAFADRRPAPSGITTLGITPTLVGLSQFNSFANVLASNVTSIALDGIDPATNLPVAVAVPLNVVTVVGGKVLVDAAATSLNGNSDGVREKLALIAQQINAFAPLPPSTTKFSWKAEVWGSRLSIQPGDIFDDDYLNASLAGTQVQFDNLLQTPNVHYYRLGLGGNGNQSTPVPGADGNKPKLTDYDAAYDVIDKEVDLYNLMVLPPDADIPIINMYPNASIRCQNRRAFLLMDPPSNWTDPQAAVANLPTLRNGLIKDYSAVFYPRVTINENGLKQNIGGAGAIAGLCARIDSTRGVWKAPAGTEADLRGVIGLEHQFSDGENGQLNPKAINTIRSFPNGIVNWGARTMDGDDSFASEYKYVPVRRLALFLEESLYRGLKWVVFEPNDEPLWAQIRLNVGAFMHDLFRQGAFQGRTPRDAYFVKCDSETTTQSDRNLGIVNIWVGFAPLKPAEFVILYLQQMAGQIQT